MDIFYWGLSMINLLVFILCIEQKAESYTSLMMKNITSIEDKVSIVQKSSFLFNSASGNEIKSQPFWWKKFWVAVWHCCLRWDWADPGAGEGHLQRAGCEESVSQDPAECRHSHRRWQVGRCEDMKIWSMECSNSSHLSRCHPFLLICSLQGDNGIQMKSPSHFPHSSK